MDIDEGTGNSQADGRTWAHLCSSDCPNGRAFARDYLAQIVRRVSEPDPNYSSRRFIRRDALLKTLNRQTVLSLLELGISGKSNEDLNYGVTAEYITPDRDRCHCPMDRCTGARIIFVTLSLTGREDYIDAFQKGGIHDHHLPFYVDKAGLVGCKSENLPLPVNIQMWPLEQKKLFCHFQWAMLVPYFTRTALSQVKVFNIDAEFCLPWSESEDLRNSGGANSGPPELGQSESIIRRVRIADGHHNLENSCGGGRFVVKARALVRPSDFKAFKAEVNAHSRMATAHENIITLLAAFTHDRLSYLLLPYAEGGSLEDLWKTFTHTPLPAWCSETWVWEQCRGLADGLSFIHGYKIVPASGVHQAPSGALSQIKSQLHGDIQPRNILCFKTNMQGDGPYTLKIADFEFSREIESPSSTIHIIFPKVAARYQSPELKIGDTRDSAVVSLKADVWCLGCVYLEFLSWFVQGYAQGVEEFAGNRREQEHDSVALDAMDLGQVEEDTFFRLVAVKLKRRCIFFRSAPLEVMAEIRQLVKDQYDQLLGRRWQDHRLFHLIETIKSHMLVVDVDRRATSEAVRDSFGLREQ